MQRNSEKERFQQVRSTEERNSSVSFKGGERPGLCSCGWAGARAGMEMALDQISPGAPPMQHQGSGIQGLVTLPSCASSVQPQNETDTSPAYPNPVTSGSYSKDY